MSQSNYSSARQGIIEDEQTYIEDTESIQEDFLDEVYETFVISGVLSGLFDIKDFWDPVKKKLYLKHAWVAAPKRWIDPAKETTATKIALQTGQKTFKQVAAENGQDWRRMIDDMAEVMEYAREKGLELGGVIYDKTAQELDPERAGEAPLQVPAEGTEPAAGETGSTGTTADAAGQGEENGQ